MEHLDTEKSEPVGAIPPLQWWAGCIWDNGRCKLVQGKELHKAHKRDKGQPTVQSIPSIGCASVGRSANRRRLGDGTDGLGAFGMPL